MIWVSFWFEEKRALLFETQEAHLKVYDIHPFIETVNFYLSYYLHKNKDIINSSNFENEQDVEVLSVAILEAHSLSHISLNPIWQALDKAHYYLQFLKSTVEIYSFDLNFDIEITDSIATLKYKDPILLNRWLLENDKLTHWYDYHRAFATTLVNEQMNADTNFIKNKSGIDYLMNLEGSIRYTISNKIARDYCLRDSKLLNVPTNSLLKILNGFVINAWGRFVQPMDDLNFQNPLKWLDNIAINCSNHSHFKASRDGRSISALPSRFSDKETLKEIIQSNLSGSESYADNLINLVSFDISFFTKVNRLKPLVNLTGKPFIKLNNFYFAFNGILGETNSQTNLLVNIMESNWDEHSKETQTEVEKMEKNVCDLFLSNGFENSISSVFYQIEEKIKGDFDIVVYEKGTLLLIELKRSKIRIHLSEANDEYENSLLRASGQLTKAYNCINSNFDKCNEAWFKKLNIKETEFSQLKFYPIIVSTSFEHDHELINHKHLKISLFELQNILEQDIEPLMGNKLDGLIMKLLRNEYWQPIENEFQLPDLDKYILRMPL